MKKKGFQLFKQRSNEDNIILNEIKLPDKYFIFLNIFTLGDQSFLHENFKYEDDLIQLTCVKYESLIDDELYENTITGFLSYKDLISEFDRYKNREEEYHDEGFIRIGYFDVLDTILLGIKNEKSDEIWKFNGGILEDKPRFQKLANNIFNFIQECKADIINLNLMAREVDLDSLYKKWGEDFWRVK